MLLGWRSHLYSHHWRKCNAHSSVPGDPADRIQFLLDSVSTASMLAFLVALLTIIGVLGSLPFVWAGYANVCLFVLLRPLYYTAMS